MERTMSTTFPVTLKRLLQYPTYVNKELHFGLRGRKIFLLLSGERDVLSRLSHQDFEPDALNLGILYHLNLLQYSETSDLVRVEKELRELLESEEENYPDVRVDGTLLVRGTVLESLQPTLNDVWVVSANQDILIFKCLQKTLTEVETCRESLLEVLKGFDNESGTFIIIAGNIARSIFLYGPSGYYKMLVEAGRLIERITMEHGHKLCDNVDLQVVNRMLKFQAERYSALAVMSACTE